MGSEDQRAARVMRACAWVIGVGLCGLVALPSQAHAADPTFDELKAKGPQALLEHADKQANRYKTARWKFKMTVKPPSGDKRTMEFTVWQKGSDDRLVRFTAPGELKGMSMLSKGSKKMYVYSPQTDNVRRVAAHARRQTLLGSNLDYSDMQTVMWSASYQASFGEETKTHAWLKLTKKADADVAWPELRVRIDKARVAADVIEYWEDGKKKRVQTRSGYKLQDGVPTYRNVEMKTVSDGLVTMLDMQEQKLDVDLDRGMFSKRNLVRGR